MRSKMLMWEVGADLGWENFRLCQVSLDSCVWGYHLSHLHHNQIPVKLSVAEHFWEAIRESKGVLIDI
jgi:hypothetical protein